MPQIWVWEVGQDTSVHRIGLKVILPIQGYGEGWDEMGNQLFISNKILGLGCPQIQLQRLLATSSIMAVFFFTALGPRDPTFYPSFSTTMLVGFTVMSQWLFLQIAMFTPVLFAI